MSVSATAHNTSVILIAGSPRGGTTISNMVLGQHPEVFATGSLQGFPHEGGLFNENHGCSCGELAKDCPFWREVRARYQPFEHLPEAEKRPQLFGIIAKLSGRRFIGDVTHNMAYANQLMSTPGIDVHLVHVVRDGRAVVYSRIRKDYKNGRLSDFGWKHLRRVFTVSRRWPRHVRQFAALEGQLGDKAVRVGYEALCHDPLATLRPVGQCLGLDFDAIGEGIGQGQPLQPLPHLIRGNPGLRARKDVVLQHDIAYLSEMSVIDRVLFQVASRLP